MGEVAQTPFSPERSSCGGRGNLRPDLGWRMFGERRWAEGRTERRRKAGGRMFKEWTQTNVDSEAPRRQVHSYRGKEREVGGGPGWGWVELDLLLPCRPSPPRAAPLELFQRALLYLIKASQAAGGAPRLVLFILAFASFKCRPGILEGEPCRVKGNLRCGAQAANLKVTLCQSFSRSVFFSF